MSQLGRPLVEVVAELPDPRPARGKRYPLAAVLALASAAMLWGDRRYSASAEWGRNAGGARFCWPRWASRTPPRRVALRVFGLVDDVVVMVAGTISATRKG